MTYEQWQRMAIAWEKCEDDPSPENAREFLDANEAAR
jgi:hypothetical protein